MLKGSVKFISMLISSENQVCIAEIRHKKEAVPGPVIVSGCKLL